jgi:hypothetical protein
MRKRTGRKLLVATLGVAAVSYVAVSCGNGVANLMAPPQDGGMDTAADTTTSDTFSPLDLVANIVAPSP